MLVIITGSKLLLVYLICDLLTTKVGLNLKDCALVNISKFNSKLLSSITKNNI